MTTDTHIKAGESPWAIARINRDYQTTKLPAPRLIDFVGAGPRGPSHATAKEGVDLGWPEEARLCGTAASHAVTGIREGAAWRACVALESLVL